MTPPLPQNSLPLKDMHVGVAPSWWPPAMGWWLLLAGVLLLIVLAAWLWQRRRRQQERMHALTHYFDNAVTQAATPAAQVVAISELLRRAARRIDPMADRLDGDAWLQFLDAGLAQPVFMHGPGALLRDGAFRPTVDAHAVAALREHARRRYLQWMQGA